MAIEIVSKSLQGEEIALSFISEPGEKIQQTAFVKRFPDFRSLDLIIRERLSGEVTPLTAEGFMRFDPKNPKLYEDVKRHVLDSERFLIARDEMGKPLCYLASEVRACSNLNFYHLAGIMTAEKYQHSGLAAYLLATDILSTEADYLILRTQSEKMHGLARKMAELSSGIALQFAPYFYPKNLEGQICRGVYQNGKSLYEDEEKFARDAIKFPDVDWRRGDSVVLAGNLKSDEELHELLNKILQK